jgi:hypothetical protein
MTPAAADSSRESVDCQMRGTRWTGMIERYPPPGEYMTENADETRDK